MTFHAVVWTDGIFAITAGLLAFDSKGDRAAYPVTTESRFAAITYTQARQYRAAGHPSAHMRRLDDGRFVRV